MKKETKKEILERKIFRAMNEIGRSTNPVIDKPVTVEAISKKTGIDVSVIKQILNI